MTDSLRSKTLRALSWSFVEVIGRQGVPFVIGLILSITLQPILMDSSKVTRAADFWSCEKNDLRNCPTIDFFMFVNGLMTPEKIVFYESATFDEPINIKIGNFVWINCNNAIGHDVIIGDYTTMFSGINIGGGAKIGSDCVISSGVTILPKIKIGNGSIIGGGAVVAKDIPSKVIAAGVSAKIIREIE